MYYPPRASNYDMCNKVISNEHILYRAPAANDPLM